MIQDQDKDALRNLEASAALDHNSEEVWFSAAVLSRYSMDRKFYLTTFTVHEVRVRKLSSIKFLMNTDYYLLVWSP